MLPRIDHRVLRIVASAPHTYTLQPPKLDRYEQPPLQRVEVRQRQFTQHVVQLEREHR
ncbi:MAG: hypothetical protein HZA52_05720 [Planctomycetes bacterium]|nr:hypothetical protein [Planctomycetota bacterium]